MFHQNMDNSYLFCIGDLRHIEKFGANFMICHKIVNSSMIFNELKVGAAIADITPRKPLFLHGYPFVKGESGITYNPLLNSLLFLNNEQKELLFISDDIIYISKDSVKRIRKKDFSINRRSPLKLIDFSNRYLFETSYD